jgi:hypothetical protein
MSDIMQYKYHTVLYMYSPFDFYKLQIFHNGQPSHGGDRKTLEVILFWWFDSYTICTHSMQIFTLLINIET